MANPKGFNQFTGKKGGTGSTRKGPPKMPKTPVTVGAGKAKVRKMASSTKRGTFNLGTKSRNSSN